MFKSINMPSFNKGVIFLTANTDAAMTIKNAEQLLVMKSFEKDLGSAGFSVSWTSDNAQDINTNTFYLSLTLKSSSTDNYTKKCAALKQGLQKCFIHQLITKKQRDEQTTKVLDYASQQDALNAKEKETKREKGEDERDASEVNDFFSDDGVIIKMQGNGRQHKQKGSPGNKCNYKSPNPTKIHAQKRSSKPEDTQTTPSGNYKTFDVKEVMVKGNGALVIILRSASIKNKKLMDTTFPKIASVSTDVVLTGNKYTVDYKPNLESKRFQANKMINKLYTEGLLPSEAKIRLAKIYLSRYKDNLSNDDRSVLQRMTGMAGPNFNGAHNNTNRNMPQQTSQSDKKVSNQIVLFSVSIAEIIIKDLIIKLTLHSSLIKHKADMEKQLPKIKGTDLDVSRKGNRYTVTYKPENLNDNFNAKQVFDSLSEAGLLDADRKEKLYTAYKGKYSLPKDNDGIKPLVGNNPNILNAGSGKRIINKSTEIKTDKTFTF